MHTLSQKTNGCILVDGQPYQAGDLRVKYDGSTISITDKLNTRNVLIEDTYDQFTNPTTSAAFISIEAFKTFILDNFFDDAANDALLAANSYTDGKVSSVQNGIGNASLTTDPATTPTVLTYGVIGGSGTYTNFLSAASTPIAFTALEISSNAWQIYKVAGSTYWSRRALPGVDLSVKANQSDMLAQQDKTSFFSKVKNALWLKWIQDKTGRMLVGITKAGKFFAAGYVDNHIPGSALKKDGGISFSNLSTNVQKGLFKTLDPRTGFNWAFKDVNGRLYMAGRKNGAVYVPKLEFTPADGTLTFSMFAPSSQQMISSLTGKKLVTIGDSITWYKKWQPLLAQLTGLVWSDVETTPGTGGNPPGGIGGSTILPMIVPDGAGGYVAGKSPTFSIYYRSGYMQAYSPDVIILFGGSNDSIPVGEVVNYADAPYTGAEFVEGAGTRPTFVAAYKGTLLKLVTNNPTARIFAMTRMYNETGSTAPDYANYQIIDKINEVIRQCCYQYSIPVIDLQREVGINTINAQDVFYMDSIHPNDEGGKRMARVIANKIC